MSKQNLLNFLISNNGKPSNMTWLEVAKEFKFREELDDDKRQKAANDIWRAYIKKEDKNIEEFNSKAKVKAIKKWQGPNGEWRQSIAYEASNTVNTEDFKKQLIKSIAEYELPKFEPVYLNYNRVCAVLNLYDAHISKLSYANETGVESNTDDTITKFTKCFDELLTTTAAFNPEIIVFPIGHDFMHENSVNNTTKKGTKLDVSGNHFDNFIKGLTLLRECIDKCSLVAKVYVPLIPGNHDTDVSNYLATALAEIFKDNVNVEIDARRITRKYFRYGTNFIGLTHGDGIKQEQLPLIMAVEQSKDFAESTERIWLTGHVHHLQTKEYPGVTVRSLRSTSDTDAWHHASGFIGAKKQGTVMLFSFEEGLKSEFNCNIK